jgi:acetyltransferase-like isoleucine patch superfamily enzyme
MSLLSVAFNTTKYGLFTAKKSNVKLGFGTTIDNKVILEGANRIGKLSSIRNVRLGFASYIGCNSFICDATIGKFSSIGDRVSFIVGKHPVDLFISTHPSFYSIRQQSGIVFTENNIYDEYDFQYGNYAFQIGHDVWIGSDVKIIQDVKVGNGAIIAAGSVVTKDVQDYEIVAGVPAKHVKYRFSENERDILNRVEWWNFDFDRLKEINHLMISPTDFFTEYALYEIGDNQ